MSPISRLHGRNGRIYMDVVAAGTAAPLPFLAKWSINFKTDKPEVTAFGDANKVYVAGLPDAQGSFSGFYDDATAQTYTAAADGLARKLYLYPSILTNTQYFWGTILVDMSIDAAVDGAIAISADWMAASAILKQG